MAEGKNNLCLNVQTPDKFTFSNPENWLHWKKRFQRYMAVSGIISQNEEDKINILLYTMGEESEQVMLQFKDEPRTYEEALKSFDDYFIPRRNVIFERFKFNPCVQKPGESVDIFIRELHNLAENCEFGNLKDELIRDRIVVGMQDVRTSERLQLQSNLTLADAVLAAKQAEVQSQQSQVLRGHDIQPQKVRVLQKGKFKRETDKDKKNKVHQGGTKERCCGFCGKEWHQREKDLSAIDARK